MYDPIRYINISQPNFKIHRLSSFSIVASFSRVDIFIIAIRLFCGPSLSDQFTENFALLSFIWEYKLVFEDILSPNFFIYSEANCHDSIV